MCCKWNLIGWVASEYKAILKTDLCQNFPFNSQTGQPKYSVTQPLTHVVKPILHCLPSLQVSQPSSHEHWWSQLPISGVVGLSVDDGDDDVFVVVDSWLVEVVEVVEAVEVLVAVDVVEAVVEVVIVIEAVVEVFVETVVETVVVSSVWLVVDSVKIVVEVVAAEVVVFTVEMSIVVVSLWFYIESYKI